MIRICTKGVPRFRHGGLEVTTSWLAVDLSKPGPRRVVVDHFGRLLQIHPHDVAKLADVGLQLVKGKLVELPGMAAPPAAAATTEQRPRKK